MYRKRVCFPMNEEWISSQLVHLLGLFRIPFALVSITGTRPKFLVVLFGYCQNILVLADSHTA